MKKSFFLLLIMLLLSSIYSFSQSKSSLKKYSLERLSISIQPNTLVIPGAHIAVGVIVKTSQGEDLKSTGWLGGKLKWKNFVVESSHGEFRNGMLRVGEDINPLKDTVITLTIKSKFHTGIEVSQLIRLNQLKEVELITNLSYSSDLSPGTSFPIDVVATYDNGIETSSSRNSGNFDKFKGYQLRVVGGYFSNNKVHISGNYHEIPRHRVKVIATSRVYRGIKDTLEVKLNYKRKYEVRFEGRSGGNGFTFFGNCGLHGRNGGRGDDGPDVNVYVSSYYDSILFQKMLKVSVREYTSSNKEFLVNPLGGSLRVISEGGKGGHGSNGADGLPGLPGRDGAIRTIKEKINDSTTVEREVREAGENGGPGGPGGNGGHGGFGGDGGIIKIYYTRDAEPFLDAILPVSIGGDGGMAGFGGNGGPGGPGGRGEPNGSDGINGIGGSSGFYGSSGRDGKIILREIDEEDIN